MSNKKEEIRITTGKKVERKSIDQKDKKHVLLDDSSTKSIISSKDVKLKPILISTTPGVNQSIMF